MLLSYICIFISKCTTDANYLLCKVHYILFPCSVFILAARHLCTIELYTPCLSYQYRYWRTREDQLYCGDLAWLIASKQFLHPKEKLYMYSIFLCNSYFVYVDNLQKNRCNKLTTIIQAYPTCKWIDVHLHTLLSHIFQIPNMMKI